MLEVGKLALVKVGRDWYGAEVTEVDGDSRRVRLLESFSGLTSAEIERRWFSAVPFEDYEDDDSYDMVEFPADIVPAKACVMRADHGTFGADTCSVGGYFEELSAARGAALESFERGTVGIHFPETPEALKGLEDSRMWSNGVRWQYGKPPVGRIEYYFDFVSVDPKSTGFTR